jgi:hypothetical protein
LLDQRIDEAAAGEDRLGIDVVRLPLVAARFGGEAGDLAVLHEQQAVAFRHDDLRAVGDDVGRALRVRAAARIRALRHGGEQRRGRRQTAGTV